jgi:transcriptional/translational regulatory protein YebC/TACO1
MAGHSHSANIKYRKDRRDSARGQLFLKLRRKIENIIREEKGVNEKSLSIARENQFPKEKVYQIWEKIQENKKNSPSRVFYQALFGVVIYLEGDVSIADSFVDKFKLKELPLSSLPSYFQLFYSLKIRLQGNNNLEEYLLANLSNDVWEDVNYNEKKSLLISSNDESIKRIKNIINRDKIELVVEEEKSF